MSATYLERDVRQLLAVKDLTVFQGFVKMCAARSGNLLNLTALGADCGVSATTARDWLSVLEASYLVFRLLCMFRARGRILIDGLAVERWLEAHRVGKPEQADVL